MKNLFKVSTLSLMIILFGIVISVTGYIHYCGEIGGSQEEKISCVKEECILVIDKTNRKITPNDQILDGLLEMGLISFSIVFIYLILECFLYKKTQYDFSKKLYLIPPFLLFVCLVCVLFAFLVGGGMSVVMVVGAQFGAIILVYIFLRLVLQNLFRGFFKKLFIFINKNFIIIILLLFILTLVLYSLISFDYQTKGEYIGFSSSGLSDCTSKLVQSGDLDEKWESMTYEEQLSLSKEFFKLDKKKQQWGFKDMRKFKIFFPVDENFYSKSNVKSSDDKDSIVLENKLFYLKVENFFIRDGKLLGKCEEKTSRIQNVKSSTLTSGICDSRKCNVYTWFNDADETYNLCAEISKDRIEIKGTENGVKIIEEIFNSIEYDLMKNY